MASTAAASATHRPIFVLLIGFTPSFPECLALVPALPGTGSFIASIVIPLGFLVKTFAGPAALCFPPKSAILWILLACFF